MEEPAPSETENETACGIRAMDIGILTILRNFPIIDLRKMIVITWTEWHLRMEPRRATIWREQWEKFGT
jgi:hypothetical protein